MKTLLSFWQHLQEANLFVELDLASLVLPPLLKKTLCALQRCSGVSQLTAQGSGGADQ